MDRNPGQDNGGVSAGLVQGGEKEYNDHCRQCACKSRGGYRRRAGEKQDACRRPCTGSGGHADDVRRGQGIAEYGLIDKARYPQGKAAQKAHNRPAEPQIQENPPLQLVSPKEGLQGQGISAGEQTKDSQEGQ